MIYLYAIGEADDQRELAAPLRSVTVRRLTAIVKNWRGESVELTESAAWEHERVVEQLMAGGPVLPARFGTLLDADEAVERALAERQSELEARLRFVRGAVELGVRAARRGSVPQAGGGARAPSGAGYLNALVERQADVETLHRPLETLSRASRIRRAAPTFAGAYLVDEDDVETFCARVQALADEVDDVELTCTGPWPPYSFSSGELAA